MDTTQYDPRQQVGEWYLVYTDGNGEETSRRVTGKLVAQDHNVFVADPETKAILFLVPSVNLSSVEPARRR